MKTLQCIVLFLFLSTAVVSADDAFIVLFAAHGETPTKIASIQPVDASFPDDDNPAQGDQYILLGKDRSILFSGRYTLTNSILYDTFVENQLTGGQVMLQEYTFPVVIPKRDDIYAIQLWKQNKFLFEDVLVDDIEAMTSPMIEDSGCITVQNTGASNQKLDLVFVGHNYGTSEMQRFTSEVTQAKNFLLSMYPFSAYPDRINIHYVNQPFDLGCVSGCSGTPQLICCNESRVWAAANQCPWTWGTDKIIVLTNGMPYGGSSALGANSIVASNAQFMNEVAAHEFGHAFGVLGDEYDYGVGGSYGMDVPNCDYAQPCPKWSSVPGTSCIPVCGYNTLFRSIQDSLMRTIPHSSYGIISERSMTTRLSSFNSDPRITSQPVTVARQGQSYQYQVIATDSNNDPLAYTFTRNPVHMTIHPTTGLITWNPVVSESRAPVVDIRVQDNRGGFATQSYSIRLLP